MTEVSVLSEVAAKGLKLYEALQTEQLNKGVALESYKSYHATDDDRLAAVLAGEHKECTLRGAVVISALLERNKLKLPKPKPSKKKRTPKGDKRA